MPDHAACRSEEAPPAGVSSVRLLSLGHLPNSETDMAFRDIRYGEKLGFPTLEANRKFRQARIRKECGPGTDPKLRHNLRSLFTAGRLYLDDELRLRFVSGPGRSGNQIHVVIDPKRVKPYVSLNPLFL